MDKLKKQTIKAINMSPRTQGIKKLFSLMNQYPQPQYSHDIIKISCIGLLEMQHDWVNLKKYIIQWNLVKKAGFDLLNRMRQRVLIEDDGTLNKITNPYQKQKYALQQLDLMFENYWQFNSPKKEAPNYEQQKITRNKSKGILIKKKKTLSDKDKEQDTNSIFQIQKQSKPINNDNYQFKNKLKDPVKSRDGMSLKLNFSVFGHKDEKAVQENKQIKELQNNKKQDNVQVKKQPQQYQLSCINKKKTHHHQIQEAPVILQKPKLKFKHDNQQKKEDIDLDFQMSAVRTRQQPAIQTRQNSYINNDLDVSNNRTNQLDNSFIDDQFAFRTNEKKSNFHIQNLNAVSPSVNKKNIIAQFEDEQISKEKTIQKKMLFHNFFTEQKMALIQGHIPYKNHFKQIFQKDGSTPKQLLKQALSTL